MDKVIYVDIVPFDRTNPNNMKDLSVTALHMFKTKFKDSGVSLLVDFENNYVNLANEKECKITDKTDLYCFLESIGYEILHASGVKGKVTVS